MAPERKLMVRMSEELHKAFRVRAAELGRPMAEIVRSLVVLWLEGKIELPETKQEGVEDE